VVFTHSLVVVIEEIPLLPLKITINIDERWLHTDTASKNISVNSSNMCIYILKFPFGKYLQIFLNSFLVCSSFLFFLLTWVIMINQLNYKIVKSSVELFFLKSVLM